MRVISSVAAVALRKGLVSSHRLVYYEAKVIWPVVRATGVIIIVNQRWELGRGELGIGLGQGTELLMDGVSFQ